MQNNSFVSNFLHGIKGRTRRLLNNPYKKAGLSWVKIKQLKHQAVGPLRSFKLKGREVFYANPQEFLHTIKELFVEEIYKAKLPTQPYIIDCGANIGLGTIFFKTEHPDAEIIAFEPDEKNYSILQKNIDSCGFKNVTLFKNAVWTEDTVLSFTNEGNMGSRIERSEAENTVQVEAVSLEKFLNKPVHFLKIDIEGAEFEVLKSIQSKLSVVENIFLEYHGQFSQTPELTELFGILNNAGFSFYIKEAASVYDRPFMYHKDQGGKLFDVQLNIFCFRTPA